MISNTDFTDKTITKIKLLNFSLRLCSIKSLIYLNLGPKCISTQNLMITDSLDKC